MYLYKMFKQDEIAAITVLKGSLNKRTPLMQYFADWNTNRAGLTNHRRLSAENVIHMPETDDEVPRVSV